MDALIAAAARALAAGDTLGALKRVALRNDPPALALRAVAMARLGELSRARELLRRAIRGFGPREAVARARCVVADAEVALALRDLAESPRSLAAAAATLDAHGDRANAQYARLTQARGHLLLGQLDRASAIVSSLDFTGLPSSLIAMAELTRAELALRSLQVDAADAALDRAEQAARRAGIPALVAEATAARAAMTNPAARRVGPDGTQALPIREVAALLDSDALVVDACRRGVRAGTTWVPLAGRPVLFALALALAEAWPGDVDRPTLMARAFGTRRPDETDRARLRVEAGRLRKLLSSFARIDATSTGFRLTPRGTRDVIVLAPPFDGDQASLVALLADGTAWSTSALALALGASQRTVQRALADIERAGRVRAIGHARARRWLAPPLTGFATVLLLPAAIAAG
jgi:hypothetical protein